MQATHDRVDETEVERIAPSAPDPAASAVFQSPSLRASCHSAFNVRGSTSASPALRMAASMPAHGPRATGRCARRAIASLWSVWARAGSRCMSSLSSLPETEPIGTIIRPSRRRFYRDDSRVPRLTRGLQR